MLEIGFNTSFKGNLGAIFKDIDIVADGLEANIKLDLNEVLNIHANFKVGENSFTDLVDIIDIDEQLIKIPFRNDVIKKGVNEFELVAAMKDGSVKASQTYIYKVVDSLENPNAVESETNYPILIELLQDVEKALEKTEETLEKAEEGLNKINEATELIDEIKDFIENSQLNNYATKDELPTKVSQLENDNKYISEIPSEYITESELISKGYLTEHQDISGKADKTELHNHANKTVLDAITSVKVQSWDNKSTFSGDYNDLTNKPSIPTKVSELTNDSGYLTSVPGEYVTDNELNAKGYLTEHQDLSDYAKTTDLHSHSNKTVLDGITNSKVAEWNNKSTFSGSYNDLSNKPAIPTKTSQLTNDSNFLTEHQDISGKADKTELHSHNNKTVLDGITSAKVTEWDNKSIFDGNYNSLTNKPTIPTVSNDLTNTLKSNYDKAYTHSQSSHAPVNAQKNSDITKAEIEAKLTGNITSHSHSQYLTQHQDLSNYATKEYVQNEITKIDTSVDIVDSVEEMTDTSKQYVYSGTNTWWRYRKVTIPAGNVLPNVDNAIKWSTTKVVLNKRLNSSVTEVDAPGCALFYFTFNDEMKNILNTIDPVWVRMKGCSVYTTTGNQTSTKVNGWNANGGAIMGCSPFSEILMYEETKNGISSNPYSSATFPYTDNKTAPVTAIKFGYYNKTVSDNSTNGKSSYLASMVNGKFALSLIVNFANTNPITESDLENVYITFNEPIVSYEEQTISEWHDTGIEYNSNDDSSIVELKTRVNDVELKTNDLETRVVKLEKDAPSNNGGNETTTSTLPSYWENRLDEISPKIDALQKEYGVDAFQFLWASDIHNVPGTAPSDTSNIGEICRYVIDKHNIPFFTVSGDIMSQASHAKVEYIWNEYEKINDMLSPVSNDEFLAVKGNHDGAWGSPIDGVYYLNNIGTKELFNAFYRRQTLDRNRVFGKDGTYFYVDCPNVRFYMLNTHTDGDGSENSNGSAVYNSMKHFVLGNEQLNWIADTLLTVQEGQKVIFMGHAPVKACLDGSIFTGILTSYKNRNIYEGTTNITGTYWGTDEKYSKVSVNKDFANAKGDLVGYFHGHIHKDTMTVDGDYPIISITTAGGDLRDDYLVNGTLTRVKGTATETAIDLVTVTGDYVYLTRIGSGYDRKYNRSTKEITIDYDSAYIPPVEEPDPLPDSVVNLMDTGELYLNQRYSHSGGGIVSDGTGMFALIVPFETNGSTTHTLKFRNLSIPLNSASGSTLYGLDSNKSNSQTINGSVIPTMTGLTILDNGKSAEIKFTAPSSVKYLALTIRVNNESTITESDISKYIITLDEDTLN